MQSAWFGWFCEVCMSSWWSAVISMLTVLFHFHRIHGNCWLWSAGALIISYRETFIRVEFKLRSCESNVAHSSKWFDWIWPNFETINSNGWKPIRLCLLIDNAAMRTVIGKVRIIVLASASCEWLFQTLVPKLNVSYEFDRW